MGTILLILLIWFIIIPIARVLWAGRKVYKQYKRAAEQATGQAGNPYRQRQEHRGGWGERQHQKKKFDRNVGEYVDFEEIETPLPHSTTASGNTQPPHSRSESQIEDAEWEEIK